MCMLSGPDFDIIINHLKKIPECTDPSKRKDCWRTAAELLSLLPPEHALGSARELDEAHCARFLANEDCPIRFAYYPDAETCQRLVGPHKQRGSRSRTQQTATETETKPLPVEPVHLDEGAPTIFLSHALGDHHFAARIRLNLAATHSVA
jgi:hypothetical protein